MSAPMLQGSQLDMRASEHLEKEAKVSWLLLKDMRGSDRELSGCKGIAEHPGLSQTPF